MSEWVEFNGFGCFRLIEAKNKYTIEQKQDEDIIPFAFHNQPFTPYLKQGTKFFDAFYRFAEDNWSAKDIKSFDEIFSEFAIELLKNRVTQDELEQRDQLRKESAERRVQNQYKDYYLSEIQADLTWYGKIYHDIGIHNRLFIDNDPPSKVVDRIISEYGLSVKKTGS